MLICSAICIATFSCASAVAAPRWGVRIKFLVPNSGLFFGGSSIKTSKAALATCSFSKFFFNAISSINPPLAQLMILIPFFIILNDSLLIIFLVFSFSGVWSVIKSDFLNNSFKSTFSTPISFAFLSCKKGS